MGQFRIEITAVGGHGCDRKAGPGDKLYNACGRLGCPDCEAREFVQQMQAKGIMLESATFTHWPGTATEIKDDLLKRERISGKF